MKRILLALLTVLCVITFVSCRENEQNINNEENSVQENPTEVSKDAPDLVKLKKTIVDNGANLGIAYIGYNEGTFSDVKRYFGESGLYEVYPFVEDMELDRYCVTGGDEHYLIVPTDDAELVQVYIGVPNFETYGVDRGELVFEATDGKPFIVRGNESEIFSNIVVVFGDVEYTPYLSGENGKLVMNDKIFDFSPYEAVNEYFGIEANVSDGTDPIYSGSWYCEAENGNYELMCMSLNLYLDHTAEYSYGYGNSTPIESFMGDWVYDAERDMILVGMYGGELDSDFNYIDPHNFECGFKWSVDYRDDGTYLVLIHEEGDPILFGKNGATFEFVKITGNSHERYSYLQATWAKISERVDTYLELFEDGSASFDHTDIDGNKISCRGAWSADGLTLYLDLYDREDGTKLLYSGEYGIMYDGEMLTLSHFDGDALTSFMAEQGYDSFILYGVG